MNIVYVLSGAVAMFVATTIIRKVKKYREHKRLKSEAESILAKARSEAKLIEKRARDSERTIRKKRRTRCFKTAFSNFK